MEDTELKMGRTKTIHKDLPPRMVARVMARGRRLFYYKAGKRFIPLGDNPNVCFLWPTVAVGVDSDGRYFFEAAWLFWVIGLGDRPQDDGA